MTPIIYTPAVPIWSAGIALAVLVALLLGMTWRLWRMR